MTVPLIAVLLFAAAQPPVEQLVQAAKKAEAAGDFQAAEKQYERAISLHLDAELLQRLGLVRHLQNKFAQAIAVFEKSVQLNPDLWGAQLFLGIDYYRTNQFSKALPHLEKALKLQPGHAEIRFWLGVTHLALKHYLQGLEILENLSSEQPQNTEILRLLAQAYSDYAVALQNDIVERYPGSAIAHLIHGRALETEGALDAALKEYRTALSLNPKLADAQAAIDRIVAAQRR